MNPRIEKISKGTILFLMVLVAASVISDRSLAVPASLSDQGTGVTLNGDVVDGADLTITIWDTPVTGDALINETFVDAIANGTWNVQLNETKIEDAELKFGRKYYKDYTIDGTDLDFGNDERLAFYSPLGTITNQTLIDGSLVCGWEVDTETTASTDKTLTVNTLEPSEEYATVNIGSAGITLLGSDDNAAFGNSGSICGLNYQNACIRFDSGDVNITSSDTLTLKADTRIVISTSSTFESQATFNQPVVVKGILNITSLGIIRFNPRTTPEPQYEVEGNMFYNSELHTFCVYNSTNWTTFNGEYCPQAVEVE